MTNQTGKPPAEIGVFSAASIGIGGMVGAGIFSVLGLAAATTKGAVPIAFVIGGVIALVTAHCYGKLSVAYPDRGGTVAYLERAFGATAFTGVLNVLLVLSYIVMVGFYASAFGRFGANFLGDSEVWRHVLITTVVFALAFVNVVGTSLVVKFGNFANFVKVGLLGAFIVVGLLSGDVDYSRFAVSEWVGPVTLVAGAMVVFLNYEGFEMIANVASDVPEEKRAQVMPRAFYGSILIVIALYVLISVVAAGSLSPSALVDAGEFALAESAEVLIGPLGFKVITVAALLATSSAINATLIAAMGSAGFLLAFAAINVASIRLSGAIGLNRWIPVVGTGMCLTAVVVMFTQVGTLELMLFLGMLVSAVLIEIVARSQGRGFTMRRGAH